MAESLIQAARLTLSLGLNELSSGNLSVRLGDGLLITPSAIPFDQLLETDLAIMDMSGEVLGGDRRPSSEWPFHTAIYKARPDVRAIVHTHSPEATALSCLREPIPSFHYMVAMLGGHTIPCSGYAMPGSRELADLVVEALGTLGGCLMANHGVIAVGQDLGAALNRAQLIETLAGQYLRLRQVGGGVMLTHEEMDQMLDAFKTYGKPGRR
ncbi:MAG: class II aldolase/adducin family protein [Gammaproteobacteria bacterium]